MKRRRPFGLKVIITLQLLQLIASVGLTLLLLSAEIPELEQLFDEDPFVNVGLTVGLAILTLLSMIGLWWLRRWGWLLLMLRLGISLSTGIWGYFYGTPDYPSLLINIITVLYLNRRDVQLLFLQPSELS